MWRWGPDGERTLCNACGVRSKRANAKIAKDTRNAACAAFRAANGDKSVRAAESNNPIGTTGTSKTTIGAKATKATKTAKTAMAAMASQPKRLSRSKAAIAAREHAQQHVDVPWIPESFCWDTDYDVGVYFRDEEGVLYDDIVSHINDCTWEAYGSDWIKGEELQDIDDVEGYYDTEKQYEHEHLSPRSPFSVMCD